MTSGSGPWLASDAPQAGDRRYAPAVPRNRDAIAAVLRDHLPATGTVLEIASGSGEHIIHFAQAFPQLIWQPSDPDPDALRSIKAWSMDVPVPNLAPPLMIDAASPDWPIHRADALLCINMVHISPWSATIGLLNGAARLLPPGGPLILYGPYIRDGVATAPSNLDFDRSLRSRNPAWGLRDIADVDRAALTSGLQATCLVEMPANNISLIYHKG